MVLLRAKPMVFLFPKQDYQSHVLLMNLKTSLSIEDYTYLGLLLLKERCFSDFHSSPRPRWSFLYKIILTAKSLKKLEEALEKELGKIKDEHL